ncbi:MAG: hypothetical protein AAGU74_06725 [Bacillota bacterium]
MKPSIIALYAEYAFKYFFEECHPSISGATQLKAIAFVRTAVSGRKSDSTVIDGFSVAVSIIGDEVQISLAYDG